ncbi:MAG: Phosphoglucomutase-3 [Bathelium mastoideum]|nr:MAG: Phosphoglucomutase-3 [Bathelium mastoideum]
MTPIEDLAQEWLRLDKDASTREEITQLLSKGDNAQLEARLRKRIAFGTAGLRARMEAGFSRMNSLTVIQTSQGLASYVLQKVVNAKSRGIVIGFDGRHNSGKFAKLTAAAFAAKGIRVWWLEILVHTPLVPFSIGELHAAAGVMITASHNPSQDNGYKVYWENGCQIVSPHDAGIANAILENLEPHTWDDVVDEDNLLVESILGRVRDAYFKAIHRIAFIEGDQLSKNTTVPIRFVYTPMHGVGLPYMDRAIKALQLPESMVVVPKQAQPDPDFPTVKFPNPEEKGALDLAIRAADENGIDLVLANDPDADRFSAAVKVSGVWHQLTGNQIGILLASHTLETHRHHHSNSETTTSASQIAMLASTVSSRMLSSMAQAEGFHYAETLTGFKWLGNVAQDLTKSGKYDVVFAYEEAIGYMFPTVAYDKDGIAAAAVFLRACQRWAAAGIASPWDKLQLLYAKYGAFAERNFYLTTPAPAVTEALFDRIRGLGGAEETAAGRAEREGKEEAATHPTHLGPHAITRWRDLTTGFDTATTPRPPDLPVQRDVQMLTVELDNDVRFTMRASGTEPKIKVYVDARASEMKEAERRAQEVGELIVENWLRSGEEDVGPGNF